MTDPDAPGAGCFAADVVRAGLDPLTGRTLAFNHVPMAAWAGHLCDLVLAGVLVDVDGVASASGTEATLHPLVERARQHLDRSLPRPWWWTFAPAVVDVNRSAADVRTWLVETGVWTRRRTVWGPRYTATGAAPSPTPGPPPGDPVLRRTVRDTLVALATFGASGATHRPAPDPTASGSTVGLVLRTARDLIAWKTANPSLPAAGTDGLR